MPLPHTILLAKGSANRDSNTHDGEIFYTPLCPVNECMTLKEVLSISFPKEDGLECGPHSLVSPVFTKDISRVQHAGQVVEAYHTTGDALSHSMVCERQVPM